MGKRKSRLFNLCLSASEPSGGGEMKGRSRKEERIASCFICPQESPAWLPSILTSKHRFPEYPAAGREKSTIPMSGLPLPHLVNSTMLCIVQDALSDILTLKYEIIDYVEWLLIQNITFASTSLCLSLTLQSRFARKLKASFNTSQDSATINRLHFYCVMLLNKQKKLREKK